MVVEEFEVRRETTGTATRGSVITYVIGSSLSTGVPTKRRGNSPACRAFTRTHSVGCVTPGSSQQRAAQPVEIGLGDTRVAQIGVQ